MLEDGVGCVLRLFLALYSHIVCAVRRCLVERCTLLCDAVCHVALLCVVVMRC